VETLGRARHQCQAMRFRLDPVKAAGDPGDTLRLGVEIDRERHSLVCDEPGDVGEETDDLLPRHGLGGVVPPAPAAGAGALQRRRLRLCQGQRRRSVEIPPDCGLAMLEGLTLVGTDQLHPLGEGQSGIGVGGDLRRRRRRLAEDVRLPASEVGGELADRGVGEEIRYLPEKRGSHATVVVPTEVREPGGNPTAIDYALYKTGGSWKVVDVKVDNISMVMNYRGTFNDQIRKKGIDGLINRLGEMNAKGRE